MEPEGVKLQCSIVRKSSRGRYGPKFGSMTEKEDKIVMFDVVSTVNRDKFHIFWNPNKEGGRK